jgi:hypothetical protein
MEAKMQKGLIGIGSIVNVMKQWAKYFSLSGDNWSRSEELDRANRSYHLHRAGTYIQRMMRHQFAAAEKPPS